MTFDMKDLADKARRLASLAEDPHPGLATWCIAFGKAEEDLRKLLNSRSEREQSRGSGL